MAYIVLPCCTCLASRIAAQPMLVASCQASCQARDVTIAGSPLAAAVAQHSSSEAASEAAAVHAAAALYRAACSQAGAQSARRLLRSPEPVTFCVYYFSPLLSFYQSLASCKVMLTHETVACLVHQCDSYLSLSVPDLFDMSFVCRPCPD